LAIYAKGGECMSPKQKDRTTTNLKFFGFAIGTNFKKKVFNWYDFQIGISLCSKRGESSIFKINILKPSWTLRGGIYQGGVLFSQRRSIWNRGRKFQILKMLCKILLIYLWLFAKKTLKRIYKRICKNKTCGASVVQNVKNEETIHAHLISIYIG
jgi:hypothetical protein